MNLPSDVLLLHLLQCFKRNPFSQFLVLYKGAFSRFCQPALTYLDEGLHQLPGRVQQCPSEWREAESRGAQQEVERRPQQQHGQQVPVEEQAVPAAACKHQPGAVGVQQPQKAQDPALVDQLDVIDVPDGGPAVSRLPLPLGLQHFSQPGQGESQQQKSQRGIQVLQRLGTLQALGHCDAGTCSAQDRDEDRDVDGGWGGHLQAEAQDDGQDRQKRQNQAVEARRRPAGLGPRTQHAVTAEAERRDQQSLTQPPAVRL